MNFHAPLQTKDAKVSKDITSIIFNRKMQNEKSIKIHSKIHFAWVRMPASLAFCQAELVEFQPASSMRTQFLAPKWKAKRPNKEILVTEDTKITKQRIQRNDLNLQEASFRKFSKSAKVPSVLWSPSTWKIKVLPQGKFIQIWF